MVTQSQTRDSQPFLGLPTIRVLPGVSKFRGMVSRLRFNNTNLRVCALLTQKLRHVNRKDILMKAYCTYVRPRLEYCSSVWSPHLKYLIDKIENVLRFFH
jgi:hypothetical protein